MFEKLRKDLTDNLNFLSLKVTIQTIIKMVNFLDVTQDLEFVTYRSFKKLNEEAVINQHSSLSSIYRLKNPCEESVKKNSNTIICNTTKHCFLIVLF